tara:strand:- start:871 stop:3519 length:2649 start_codon:yes stop_codon:yes gene_type:complete
MAEKTPVRVVFNASNVATGLAEFQSGDSVGVAFGGTGLNAIGSAGQVLKVNAAGSALEFGAEGDISITNLIAPTNSDLTLTTSGTGNIVLDAITVRGTTFSAADSSSININEGLIVDGTLSVSGQATLSGLVFPTSDGSANQFLKTDGSGNLSFADVSLGDFSFIGSTISNSSNADLSIQPNGTGDILISGIRINGTTLDSSDSTGININENVIIDGNLNVTGTVDFADQNISNVGSLSLDSISGDADSNTSITFSGSDVITMATGGSTAATFNADQTTTFSGAVSGTSADFDGGVTIDNITIDGTEIDLSSGDLTIDVAGDLILEAGADVNIPANIGLTFGDDGEKIEGDGTDLTVNSSNDLHLTATTDINIPANVGLTFGDDGEKIEGDGTNLTITSSGTTTLNSTGDIILDGSNTTSFKAAGTEYFKIVNNSGSAVLRNTGQDNDISFLGNDGGATITALALDMSAAGAATFNDVVILGTNKEIRFVDTNESIKSDGSKMIIKSGGTTFNLPIADGSSGDTLITDGAGTLSFSSSTPSDDTRAVVKNNKAVSTTARTVDYFQSSAADVAWYFVALNDLTNDHSSASCFAVVHNDSDAFIGGPRGGASGSDNSLPSTTADISSNQVRVKIAAPSNDSKISYYKIPISRANTADATAGVTVTTSNTDVDSASESIDTFAHASFRAAKYLIIIDDNAKTETGVTEALVVHDGTNAFVTQHGTVQTGNNDMITLSAAISGSNVVLSAAGLTPNLSLKIHKTLLSDSMTAVSNNNQKIIGATTVSSTATAFDSFDLDDVTAAMYYVVGKNATEGAFSVQEVYCAGAPGEASVSHGPFVSTKGTVQLNFTAAFDADEDNTLQMSVSSTSGGSTVVNAYRINCLAE